MAPKRKATPTLAPTTTNNNNANTNTTNTNTTNDPTAVTSSTRLYVQNLPAYVDTKRLREHFASHGDVTDAVVVRTKDGLKSRRFGFVGFKTEAQAASARQFFHQSFFDTSRLNVTFAVAKAGDAPPSLRPRKGAESTKAAENTKVAENETAENENADDKKKNKNKKAEVEEGDPAFAEFMETMQARSKSKFWANDDVQGPAAAAARDEAAGLFADDSDDEDDEIHEVKASDDDDSDSEKLRKGDKRTSQKPLSDLDFLRSKVSKKLDKDSDDDDEDAADDDDEDAADDDASMASDSEDEEEKTPKKKKTKETAEPSADAEEEENDEDKPTARLFVRNLPFTAVEEDLTDLFSSFGSIVEVHMPLDDAKRRKGFGFVLFKNTVDAQRALEELNGTAFQGRRLHVIYARVKPEKIDPKAALEDPTLTYKQKKELERQLNASKSTGWNASFIRGDATVGTLAERMGVQRGDIMDKTQGNMAVRLAIGETMLVKENKEFFAQQGVDLDAIEGALVKPGAAASKAKIERSTTVLLVKNLPHTTDDDELAALFRKHGDLGRFLVAPSKTLALVEFFEPSEARRAFRSLAYKKYQHVPLYLEWAPVKVFSSAPGDTKTTAGVKKTAAAALGVPDVEDVDAGDQEDQTAAAEANNTICVKNLSFNTKESGLETLFRSVGKVRKVTVARRKDPKRGMLSMGFGFVEFADAKDAEKAITTLQSTVLDGHALNLRLSQKKINGETTTGAKRKSEAVVGRKTKIMVRNVAFEATGNEIRELFGAFGQLKRVRMPKKFDGKHRGFAFVEFLTEQEAITAFRALSSSHLYGRHLVLEWATDADDMDTLRAKASRDLNGIAETDRRKRVKQNQDELAAKENDDDADY